MMLNFYFGYLFQRLKLRRGYSVHQQCDEDLGLQGDYIFLITYKTMSGDSKLSD